MESQTSQNNYSSDNSNEEIINPEKLLQSGINSIFKTFKSNNKYYISQINEQKIIINKLTNKLELINQEMKMLKKEITYYKIQNKKLQKINENLMLNTTNIKEKFSNKINVSNIKDEEQTEKKLKSNGISNYNIKCDLMNDYNDLKIVNYENKVRLFDSFDEDKKNIYTEKKNDNNELNNNIHITKSLSSNNLIIKKEKKNEKLKIDDSYKTLNNGSYKDQYNEIKTNEMKFFLQKCGVILDKNIYAKVVRIFQEYKSGLITDQGFVKKIRHYLKNKDELMILFEKVIS